MKGRDAQLTQLGEVVEQVCRYRRELVLLQRAAPWQIMVVSGGTGIRQRALHGRRGQHQDAETQGSQRGSAEESAEGSAQGLQVTEVADLVRHRTREFIRV